MRVRQPKPTFFFLVIIPPPLEPTQKKTLPTINRLAFENLCGNFQTPGAVQTSRRFHPRVLTSIGIKKTKFISYSNSRLSCARNVRTPVGCCLPRSLSLLFVTQRGQGSRRATHTPTHIHVQREREGGGLDLPPVVRHAHLVMQVFPLSPRVDEISTPGRSSEPPSPSPSPARPC